MGKRRKQSKATWVDVKAKLASFNRAALLSLIQNLYASDRGNRAFLHARFGLGDDPLCPYKNMIDRWLWPDAFRDSRPLYRKPRRQSLNTKRRSAILWAWRNYSCSTANGPLDSVRR